MQKHPSAAAPRALRCLIGSAMSRSTAGYCASAISSQDLRRCRLQIPVLGIERIMSENMRTNHIRPPKPFGQVARQERLFVRYPALHFCHALKIPPKPANRINRKPRGPSRGNAACSIKPPALSPSLSENCDALTAQTHTPPATLVEAIVPDRPPRLWQQSRLLMKMRTHRVVHDVAKYQQWFRCRSRSFGDCTSAHHPTYSKCHHPAGCAGCPAPCSRTCTAKSNTQRDPLAPQASTQSEKSPDTDPPIDKCKPHPAADAYSATSDAR